MSIVSWRSGISADWSQAADWSGSASPSSTTTASITAAGNYVVTLFGTASAAGVVLNAQGAEFYDAGSLALGGAFALQAGTLALEAGSLGGGTLALEGGQLQAAGGTLNGVSVQGSLALTGPEATLYVRNGLSLSGSGGLGAGAIQLTGGYAALDFLGSQTLTNATVTIGASGSQPGQTGAASLGVSEAGGTSPAATLTLGPSLWVRDTGGQAELLAGPASLVQPQGQQAALVNQGTITANGAGAVLTVAGGGIFTNQGTVAVSNGATLDLAAGGFSNTGTLSVSNATLELGGGFSSTLLANLGAVSLSNGQVVIAGTAENAGTTLALGSGSQIAGALGTPSLSGTILGGVVLDSGGGLRLSGGVLDGVSYEGSLNLAGAGAAVTLTDSSEVSSGTGGLGTIADTGAGAALLLRGSETLTNATIALGSGTAGAAAAIGTSDAWLASTATTATLGSGVSVVQTGAAAALEANGWSPVPGFGTADTLVNQGSVSGAVAGGQLSLSGYGTLINEGSIGVSHGDTLSVTVEDFDNTGTLTAGPGGTVLMGQSATSFGTPPGWTNTGTIAVNGGTLVLGGVVATSQLGTITETAGSSIVLAGLLNNAGTTLSLGAGAGAGGGAALPSLSLNGTISGGTIADPGGVLVAGNSGGALLDGVAYQGTIALSQAGAFLRIRDGLALSGTAEVTGAGSVLDFQGNQTISGGTIVLGASGSAASLDITHDYGSPGASTLTLGPGVAIQQQGALATIGRAGGVAGDMILNQGTITAGVAGGTLSLGGPGFSNAGLISISHGETLSIGAQAFSNTGTLAINGGQLSLAGSLTLAQLGDVTMTMGTLSVSGTLNLGGGTLSVGQGSAIGRLLLTGTVSDGTILDGGSGLSLTGGANLQGVTYEGPLDLSRPFANATIGSLTLTGKSGSGAGSIVLTGVGARLDVSSSQTLGNTQITLGSAARAYNGMSLAAPELAADPGVTLTLGSQTTLTEAGTGGTLGDSSVGQWSDSIVNAGQINAASLGGTLSLDSSFFTNTGSIAASNGDTVTLQNAGFVNDGTISIGAGATIAVTLFDFFVSPDAAGNVFSNSGIVSLAGGTLSELTGGGLFPNEPLANLAGATLRGFGDVSAQISNSGTIEAQGGAMVLLQSVLGSGKLLIASGSTLELGGAVAANQTVQFLPAASGTASLGSTLKLDQPAAFAGTLSGLAAGDSLDLAGQTLTSVGLSNGTLVVGTGTQNLRFAPASALNGLVSAAPDGQGGTAITFTPQTGGTGSAGGAPSVIQVGKPGMLFWASSGGDVFKSASTTLTGAHIANWTSADSLDVTDMISSKASLTLKQASGVTTLTLSDGTHSLSIGLTGTFTTTQFHLASDGHGGTAVTYHA